MRARLAFLRAVWLYSTATWIYVVVTVLDPITNNYQGLAFSQYIPVQTDIVGIGAFLVGFLAYIGLQISEPTPDVKQDSRAPGLKKRFQDWLKQDHEGQKQIVQQLGNETMINLSERERYQKELSKL